MKHPYEDILYLPYTGSKRSKRISLSDRGAQFSPFAALTGYDAKIHEAARLTEQQVELDVDARILLDKKLSLLSQHLIERPKITITYFVPDTRKSGGAYETVTEAVRKIDVCQELLILENGQLVPLGAIYDISCELFCQMDGLSFGE